jgi:hypothetical protein
MRVVSVRIIFYDAPAPGCRMRTGKQNAGALFKNRQKIKKVGHIIRNTIILLVRYANMDKSFEIRSDLLRLRKTQLDIARDLVVSQSLVSQIMLGLTPGVHPRGHLVKLYIQWLTRRQYWDDVPVPESDPRGGEA